MYACLISQRYRQRKAWKYLFLPQYGIAENTLVTASAPRIDWSQFKGDYASFSVLSNILQNDLSKW